MKETELFTDSQIGLDDLASRLNISSKSLSQAINEGYQKTFFIISTTRIGKAMDMLQSDEHTNLSIEGIATVVGFQSKSSFYTAFKKNNGITPTDFRDKVKSQVSR
jgi:AraC-like DNA-binding protein